MSDMYLPNPMLSEWERTTDMAIRSASAWGKEQTANEVRLRQQRMPGVTNAEASTLLGHVQSGAIDAAQAARLMSSMAISKQLGVPLEQVITNNELFLSQFGIDTETVPEDKWYDLTIKAIKRGSYSIEINQTGAKLREAYERGDLVTANYYKKEIETLRKEQQVYIDPYADKRNPIVRGITGAMESASYMAYISAWTVLGSLVAPGVGTAAGFMAGWQLNRDSEYMSLLDAGVKHEIANRTSLWVGAAQSAIESLLGRGAGAILNKVGGKTAARFVTDKVTNAVFSKIHLTGLPYNIAKYCFGNLWEAAGEGTEEVLQALTSRAGLFAAKGIQMKELEKALANPASPESKALLAMAQNIMLEDEIRMMAVFGSLEVKAQLLEQGVEIDDWDTFVKQLAKEFEGGFLSALVLQAGDAVIATGMNFQQAKDLRDAARANPSKADFLEKTEGSGIPRAVRENTWEAQSKNRDREEAAMAKEEAALAKQAKERGGLGEGMEERAPEGQEQGKEGRRANGRLYTQDVQKIRGSVRTGTFKFGDPGREIKANLHGWIDYRIDGDTVTVKNMEVVPWRKNLTGEFFTEFSREFSEYDITFDAKSEAQIELKNELIQNNGRGAEAGLNYFEKDGGISADDQQTGQRVSAQFREQDPRANPRQMNLINRMVHSYGRAVTGNAALDLAGSWRALGFNPDNIFTDEIRQDSAAEFFALNKRDWGRLGITEGLIAQVRRGEVAFTAEQLQYVHDHANGFITILKKDAAKYIYLGKHGNFSTMVHEVAHAVRRVLPAEMMREAEAALGVKNGNWTREHEEAFAKQAERYYRTGEIQDQRLKVVFDQIREILTAIYKSIKDIIGKENPELNKVFEALSAHMADENTGGAQRASGGVSGSTGYQTKSTQYKAAPEAATTLQEGNLEGDEYNDIEAWVKTLPEENQRLHRENKALNEGRESLDKNTRPTDAKPVIEGVEAEDLEGLKAKAREGHDFIRDLANKWAQKWDDGAKGRPGFETQAVIKSDERAVEKHEEESTPYNEMLDMVGFTVVVKDLKTLLEMANEVVNDEAVVRVKDRYKNPPKGGYRDFLLNVKAPNGFVGEIQLNVEQMYDAKEQFGGHAIYEVQRALATEVKNGNIDSKTADKDKAILDEISEKFYEKAAGLVYAEAQASASSLDMRSPSFSVYTEKNGVGDNVLSAFTANSLQKLSTQALLRHSTNESLGSSKSGTLGDSGAKSSGFPLNKVSTISGTSTSNIAQHQESVNTQNENIDTSGVPAIRERYQAAKRTEGWEDTKNVGGEELEGRWVLVEAETPTASHDETAFTETSGFPSNRGKSINDRDYRSDKAAQEAVIKMAGGFDGRAIEGIVITGDGVVISGNNRTMSGKLAAKNDTDVAYVETLAKKARKYGFTAEQVQEFEHPRLVFETEVGGDYSTDLFARFNRSTKKSMTPLETAVKMTKRLAEKPEIINKIAASINEHESLTELYNDKKATRDIFKTLKDAGFVGEYELPQYLSEEGAVTGAGEDLIESVMLGAVLTEDVNRGLQESKDLRRKLVRGITPLMENKGMGDYSLTEEVNEAAGVVIQVKRGDAFKSVDDYANQQILLDEEITPAKRASIQLAQALESGGQKEFHDWMAGLNSVMAVAAAGQQDMFGAGVESKEQVLDRYVRWFDGKETKKKENAKVLKAPAASLADKAEAAASNAGIAKEEVLFQTAYHGSPYWFDKHNNSYVGSGFGNLRHGWGHYLYGQKEAAEWFRQSLSKVKGVEGQLYEVDIPGDEELLHWDKPLSEQPEVVQRAADELITWDKDGKSNFHEAYNLRQFNDDTYGFFRSINGKMKWGTIAEAQDAAVAAIKKELTGQEFYTALAEMAGEKETSLLLDYFGVKGTKYLDKSTEKIGVSASYNHVIFGDSDIDITQTFFQMDDSRAAEVISINPEIIADENGGKIDLKNTRALTQWIRNYYQGREITISDDGLHLTLTRKGLESSVKRRGERQRQMYAGLDRLIETAVYDDFIPGDTAHPKVEKQNIYYAAARIGDKLYSVEIKVDIPVDKTNPNYYKDHKITEIKIEPSLYVGSSVSGPSYQEEGSISKISIDVLNGKVKPSRVEAETLFQMDDLFEEAAEYDSWEEFRDSQEGGGAASAADNAWYQSFYKDSKKAFEAETLFQDDAETADEAFLRELDNEAIDEAVRELWNNTAVELEKPLTDDSGKMNEKEKAGYDKARSFRDRLEREMPDRQKWLARAVKVGTGGTLSEDDYSYLRRLVRKNPRDYRAVFADLLDRQEWAFNLAGTENGEPNARLADPHRKAEKAYSEERLQKIAERVSDPKLAGEIRDGAVTLDDPRIRAWQDGLEEGLRQGEEAVKKLEAGAKEDYGKLSAQGNEQNEQLAELYKQFQAAAEKASERELHIKRKLKAGEILTERYQRETQLFLDEFHNLHEQLIDMGKAYKLQAEVQEAIARDEAVREERRRVEALKWERSALREVREIKKRLVKQSLRKAGPGVAWAQAKTIKVIQSLLQPNLLEGLQDWMKGLDTPSIMELHSRYWSDQEFREKLLKKVNPRRVPKLERLMAKNWDTLTGQDKRDIVKAMPKANWVQELGLEKLVDAMEASLPRHLRNPEGGMIVSEEDAALAKAALGEAAYTRLLNKPFASWTVLDMAEVNEVIGDLYAEGRKNERGRQEARLMMRDRYRERMIKLIKTAWIKEGAAPEEIDKKINAFRADKYGRVKKNNVWNSFYDADVRRFANVLGGGIATDLLYRMENDCFTAKERGKAGRAMLINEAMKKNNITINDLEQWVEIKEFWADGRSQMFTVDDLLFFRRAVMNDFSRKAVMYGNFSDVGERGYFEKMGGKTGFEAFGDVARERLGKVLDAAAEFLGKEENKKFLKLSDAIGRDYDMNGPRLNEASVKMFNQPIGIESYYVKMIRKDGTGGDTDAEIKRALLEQAGVGQMAVNKGQTKERQHISPFHQTEIETGLYKTWLRSLESDEHLIAYGEYVQTVNAVFNGKGSEQVMAAIKNRYGEAAKDFIKDYIAMLANPNPKIKGGWDKYIKAARGKTATAYLAWRAPSVIKQLVTSPWPYLQEISPLDYIPALFEVGGYFGKINKLIREKSVYMDGRLQDVMMQIIKEEADKTTNPVSSRLNKFNRLGMGMLEWADWTCVAPGWLAVYRRETARLSGELDQKISGRAAELVQEGLGKDEAARRATLEIKNDIDKEAVYLADDTVRRLQPSNRKMDMARMFWNRDGMGHLVGAVLQFQAALNVIWKNIRYDIPHAIRVNQGFRVVGIVASYAFAGICLGLLSGIGDDDDDKLTDEQKAWRWVYRALTQFSDAVPVIGSDIVSPALERLMTGRNTFYRRGSLFPAAEKLFSGAGNLPGIFNDDPAKREKALDRVIKDMASAGALITGAPLSGAKDIGRTFGIGDGKPGMHFNPLSMINGKGK